MKEYIRHLDEYFNYPHSAFSNLVPEDRWGDKKLAEQYLDRYWLPEKEYLRVWKSIQDVIFVPNRAPHENIFLPKFETFVTNGGCLFTEDDLKKIQKLMIKAGEQAFVIIQTGQDFTQGEPTFRMKFPVAITWAELISGNYISAVLLEMNYNEYYVFGSSGRWGKFAGSDQEDPIDIFGFDQQFYGKFKKEVNENLS